MDTFKSMVKGIVIIVLVFLAINFLFSGDNETSGADHQTEIDEVHEKGYKEGYSDGYHYGYNAGYEDGFDEATENFRDEFPELYE